MFLGSPANLPVVIRPNTGVFNDREWTALFELKGQHILIMTKSNLLQLPVLGPVSRKRIQGSCDDKDKCRADRLYSTVYVGLGLRVKSAERSQESPCYSLSLRVGVDESLTVHCRGDR